MRSPLNDIRFINRRHLRNKQALSAVVIYNDLSILRVVQQIPQGTRDIISRSTSNNNSQAQEFNLPDVLVTVKDEMIIAQNEWSYL